MKEKLSRFEHEEAIKIFDYIQAGLQPCFPQGYFSDKGMQKIIVIFKHYLFDICEYTEDEAVENLTYSTIKTIGMENAMISVFGAKSERISLLREMFPHRKPWELVVIQSSDWSEMKKEYALWFLEEYHSFTRDTIFDTIEPEKVRSLARHNDSFIGRNFRRYTGLSDLLATAYDMDIDDVKSRLKKRTISERFSTNMERVNEITSGIKEDRISKANRIISMLYYIDKFDMLGCTIINGNTEEEIAEKASGIARENNAVKFWVTKIDGGFFNVATKEASKGI